MTYQMKTGLIPATLLFLSVQLTAQAPAFNQNSSRSNNAKAAYNQNEARSNRGKSYYSNDAWNFGINSGASLGVKSDEKTLFRGNSLATKMFANYFMGNAGIGLSGGFIPGALSDNAISSFMSERKYQRDQVQVTQSKPFNGYLLAGPSFKFGNRIEIQGNLQGGIFLSNPGAASFVQSGATRPLYRFDAGDKNLFPGFSGNINIKYPVGHSSSFFISTEYLQSKSSIRIYDPQRGIDIPALQNRNVKLFNFGIGISKTFERRDEANGRRLLPTVNKRELLSPRDLATGQASGKTYQPGKPVYGNIEREIAIDESGVHRILSPRDIATGQASGKRVLPTVNKREIAIDESGVHRIVSPRDVATGQSSGKRMNESCGPVTIKKTFPDGTTEEKTFACPDDAIAYQDITEQASWSTSDTKKAFVLPHVLEKSGIIHRDISARNILAGRVSWGSNSPTGIETNISAAVSSVSNLAGGGGGAAAASYARNGVATGAGAAAGAASLGIVSNIYAREAGSGMSTGKRSVQSPRDVATGQSSGKRQYQPIFFEGKGTASKDGMASANTNPLYEQNVNSGTNPMYEDKSKLRTTGDEDCDGIAGLNVYLIDITSGAAVATTQTESCGGFFFANVPSGNYIVKVAGEFAAKKGYDVYLKNKMDVAGEMLFGADYWSIDLATDTGSVEHAQALIKTKTKSNQSNDRLVNTSRSNIKNIVVAAGDLDGDGATDVIVGLTVAKQTQGATFGEKVNAGLHAAGGALSQGASLLGGALPGGSVISAAKMPGEPIPGIDVRMPGEPIPGIDVRLKQMSNGETVKTQTNEFGEFEFTDLKEGNYSIGTQLNYYIDDETIISIGDEGANSNYKGDVKVTASQNSQALKSNINNINGGMPNRISMNVTVPKQTQGATFGEKLMSGESRDNNPATKLQNNNTVRSNRSDNAFIVADLDGDGEMESSYLNFKGEAATITMKEPDGVKDVMQTQVKTASVAMPVKWTAPEVISKKVWGDPHVDEKDGSLKLGSGNFGTVYTGKWNSTPLAIKKINCADGICIAITAKGDDYPAESKISLNGLPPGEPVRKASVFFTDNNGNTYKKETDNNGRLSLNGLPPGVPLRMMMNIGVDGSEDILITFSTDAQGNRVSNVLKTKHDTAKNSVGNIR